MDFLHNSKRVAGHSTGVVLFIIIPSDITIQIYPFVSSTIPFTLVSNSCCTQLYILPLISNFTIPPPNELVQRMSCLASQSTLVILRSIPACHAASYCVNGVREKVLSQRFSVSKSRRNSPFQVVR